MRIAHPCERDMGCKGAIPWPRALFREAGELFAIRKFQEEDTLVPGLPECSGLMHRACERIGARCERHNVLPDTLILQFPHITEKVKCEVRGVGMLKPEQIFMRIQEALNLTELLLRLSFKW